ncbi:AAEL000463-PA [Aedes aegypti]|uniref:Uncharacterized protein n=2 Tax=Aedes aegypti TaxID=7159 RepID=Q17PB9_AEDAE|nr:uncharacterized protein LOC5577333 [Aedes aegypti]XP_021712779.1 uncharacterized protein LOC110681334 [Aedes aegypti]EAT48512.1 AAEL000463-PA [Aedes aegypti]
MAEVSRSYKVHQSSDERSCPSEDRKRRIRKMIEVTRSTRYTAYVEGDEEMAAAAGTDLILPSCQMATRTEQDFTTTMAVLDSSLGKLPEVIGDDRARFGSKCRKMANQFLERLQEIDVKVEECAKTASKYKKLDGQIKVEKRDMVKKLRDVLETGRKKREKREKFLMSLMKRMA